MEEGVVVTEDQGRNIKILVQNTVEIWFYLKAFLVNRVKQGKYYHTGSMDRALWLPCGE